MLIKRNQYLKNIRRFYESNLIKVLTGVRRCGKSVLVTCSNHLYKVWNFLGRNVKIG